MPQLEPLALILIVTCVVALVLFDLRYQQMEEQVDVGSRAWLTGRAILEALVLIAITANTAWLPVAMVLGGAHVIAAAFANWVLARREESDLVRAGCRPQHFRPPQAFVTV